MCCGNVPESNRSVTPGRATRDGDVRLKVPVASPRPREVQWRRSAGSACGVTVVVGPFFRETAFRETAFSETAFSPTGKNTSLPVNTLV